MSHRRDNVRSCTTDTILFVTHVEDEQDCLKIWAQQDIHAATCVERFIYPLIEQFSQGYGCPSKSNPPIINSLCCGRFKSDGYYRAKILDVRRDGMIVVHFIDYGNLEILPPNHVHLLNNISGAEPLLTYPAMATEFILLNVLPINGVWENRIIETIKNILCYNEYRALVNNTGNNHLIVKLWYNNENFSDLLVKRQLALPANVQDSCRVKSFSQPEMLQAPIYQQQNEGNMNNFSSMPIMQNTNMNQNTNMQAMYRKGPNITQPKYIASQIPLPVQEALVFKSRVLDVGTMHEVLVSCVEDGPQKFSVQVQSTTEILSRLMEEINSRPKKPLQEPPLPGSVCLGYTEGKVLCRAVVMSVMEHKCKLYYVDFGHTEVLSYTDIFQLPPKFISPKVLSIRFTLSGLKELNITPEMKNYFKKLVSRKLLCLQVRPPEGPPLIQYGDLYDNGVNIKDMLKKAFPVPATVPVTYSYPQLRRLSKDVQEIVHVSFVESCHKFFVQLVSGEKSLQSIMAGLAQYAKTASAFNVSQLKVGLPCAALYDSEWYRAQIISVNGNEVEVVYVDYGNEETLSIMSLRTIHDDLVTKLPAQAIKCALNGYEVLLPNQEVISHFERLTLEKNFFMKVVASQPNNLLVDLFELDTMRSIHPQLFNNPFCDITAENSTSSQNGEIQQQKTSNLYDIPSDDKDKYNKKSNTDSWNRNQNIKFSQDSRPKIWKEKQAVNSEWSSEKQYDNKRERSSSHSQHDNRRERSSSHSQHEHDKSQNDRFAKDETANNKRLYNKYDKSEDTPNRSNREGFRNDRNRHPINESRINRNDSNDKTLSDKDSDTSSKGHDNRGKSSFKSSTRKERYDNGAFKQQTTKWNDRNNDKSGYNRNERVKDNDDMSGNNLNNIENYTNISYNQEYICKSWDSDDANIELQSKVAANEGLQFASISITLGTVKNCEIVFINSPLDFFIQLNPEYLELEPIMYSIAETYEKGGETMQAFKAKCDTCCIAQYEEDLKWYRAVIKSVEGNNATVKFIDYGNIESVDFTKIKVIQEEFMKLPMQAVQCKLLGLADTGDKEAEYATFIEKIEGKSLEVEFVAEENGIYKILLWEVVKGVSKTCINKQFCTSANLTKAKETALNKGISNTTARKAHVAPDYAPFNSKWEAAFYEFESKYDVIITWFITPSKFYCQTLTQEAEFETMMNEIQKIYASREPIKDELEIGSPVIAIFSEDKTLYRAEVVSNNTQKGYIVQYIDFGNCATVKQHNIYPVEKKFMQLPRLAAQCTLRNIIPNKNLSWFDVNDDALINCFDGDKYECIFHALNDDQYMISLSHNGQDVGDTLVKRNLAAFACEAFPPIKTITSAEAVNVIPELSNVEVTKPNVEVTKPDIEVTKPDIEVTKPDIEVTKPDVEITKPDVEITKPDVEVTKPNVEVTERNNEIERVDINLLSNQVFKMKVSNVKSTTQFYVQLPSASKCEYIIDEYMADKNAEVMPRLSSREMCFGAGCLVNANGTWRRAVVINCSHPVESFQVKFIDTGACDEILDNALALPGALTVMQKQVLECFLQNVQTSPDADKQLKELIEGKEVLVHVLEVNDSRLIVKLFDLHGNGIMNIGESDAKILPICTTPLLSSTHVVHVTCAMIFNNVISVWIQRHSDYKNLMKLLVNLEQYYSNSGQKLEPKPNVLCAIKNADGHWHRGIIISCNETTASVFYLDIGNIIEIALSESFMVLEPQFYEPHKLVMSAIIPLTLVGTETEQLSILKTHLMDGKDLIAVFYNMHNKWFVELTENGEKICDRFRSLNLIKEEGIPAQLVSQMQESGANSVYVSHIDSPSQFWLQWTNENSSLFEFQDKLQLEVSNFLATEGIPEEGTLCAAVYSLDDKWYRAEVLDADEDITTIRFIDFGNTDVIDNTGHIRQLPDAFKNINRYAFKCKLDIIPVDMEDWSPAVCQRFTEIITSVNCLQVSLITNTVPLRVELFINGKSISEILVEEKLAIRINSEQAELVKEEIVDIELDPHSAFVSHINSPSEFWVQEEKSIADLEVMTDRFMVADMFPKIDIVKEGLLCVAKYPEDSQWYRARVLSNDVNGTQVIFIDYGNSTVSTEIRTLPEDLANVPPLSRKCCLQLPSQIEEWSGEACNKFVELAADGATIFILDVLKEQETSVVKLTWDNQNVADILASLCKQQHSPVIEERLPPLGEENSPNVMISHINSPDEFWIQAESSISELEVMSDRLRDAQSFVTLSTFDVGTVCAALYPEDESWYRAKILACREDGTEVLYMDYGNSAVTEELRVLPQDIVDIPILSKRCSLEKPYNVVVWSERACEKFKELAAEGATLFQFETLDEDDPIHVRLSLNRTNVVEFLQTEFEDIPQVEEETEDEAEDITSTTEKQVEVAANEIFFEEDYPTEEISDFSKTIEQKLTLDRNTPNTNLPCFNQTKQKLENVIDNDVINKSFGDSDIGKEFSEEEQNHMMTSDKIEKATEEFEVMTKLTETELSVDEIIQNMAKDTTEDSNSQEIDGINLSVADKPQSVVQDDVNDQQVRATQIRSIDINESSNLLYAKLKHLQTIIQDDTNKQQELHSQVQSIDINKPLDLLDANEKQLQIVTRDDANEQQQLHSQIQSIDISEPLDVLLTEPIIVNKRTSVNITENVTENTDTKETLSVTNETQLHDVQLDTDQIEEQGAQSETQPNITESLQILNAFDNSDIWCLPKEHVNFAKEFQKQSPTEDETACENTDKNYSLKVILKNVSTDQDASSKSTDTVVMTSLPSVIKTDTIEQRRTLSRKRSEDKIVPGCISRGESPDPEATTLTPKISANVASTLQPVVDSAREEDDEILTVSTENIP